MLRRWRGVLIVGPVAKVVVRVVDLEVRADAAVGAADMRRSWMRGR